MFYFLLTVWRCFVLCCARDGGAQYTHARPAGKTLLCPGFFVLSCFSLAVGILEARGRPAGEELERSVAPGVSRCVACCPFYLASRLCSRGKYPFGSGCIIALWLGGEREPLKHCNLLGVRSSAVFFCVHFISLFLCFKPPAVDSTSKGR